MTRAPPPPPKPPRRTCAKQCTIRRPARAQVTDPRAAAAQPLLHPPSRRRKHRLIRGASGRPLRHDDRRARRHPALSRLHRPPTIRPTAHCHPSRPVRRPTPAPLSHRPPPPRPTRHRLHRPQRQVRQCRPEPIRAQYRQPWPCRPVFRPRLRPCRLDASHPYSSHSLGRHQRSQRTSRSLSHHRCSRHPPQAP